MDLLYDFDCYKPKQYTKRVTDSNSIGKVHADKRRLMVTCVLIDQYCILENIYFRFGAIFNFQGQNALTREKEPEPLCIIHDQMH